MAKVVYRYQLTPHDNEVPAGKVVLVAAQQPSDAMPTMWVEHDFAAQTGEDSYIIHGTGHTILDDVEHVGSAVCSYGNLVWHVYKKVK